MTPALELVLLWHMHQPDYRDPASGEFLFPWVYLHALKDYSDMAWHLEQHPRMRATVNLVPVLLDQIEDYCRQFERAELRDPLLRLLIHPDPDAIAASERALVLDSCFRNNHARMIEPFPTIARWPPRGQSFDMDRISRQEPGLGSPVCCQAQLRSRGLEQPAFAPNDRSL